ncbi:pyridoxal-phosphate dependent enzyme [Candidatus Vidania fulgoroideorum]
MIYISTICKKKFHSFEELIFNSIPKEGGLYIPYKIPNIYFNKKKNNYTYIINKLLYNFIGSRDYKFYNIKEIVKKNYSKLSKSFYRKKTKIRKIKKNKVFILNLNGGNTFSFKDFSVSFIVDLISLASSKIKKKISIITATSGDTGASSAFYTSLKSNLKNIILSPFQSISKFQESQMYGIYSKNIFNISIKGNFDDCQKIVKYKLKNNNFCTINSINFIRILLQSAYYIKYSNILYKKYKNKPYFCIPTGNFGNAFSCYLANLICNKIKGALLSNNENNYTYRLFNKYDTSVKKIIKTDCPSIDINIPSNLERYIRLIAGEKKCKNFYKKNIFYKSILDKNKFFNFFYHKKKERKKMLCHLYKKNRLLMDTHTVNSFITFFKKKNKYKNLYVIINTANFIKFKTSIEFFIGKEINIKFYKKVISIRKKYYFFNIKDFLKLSNFIDIINEESFY